MFHVLQLQRLGLEWTTPALLDSTSSLAAILHGLYNINVDINISLVKVPRLYGPPAPDAGLSFIYLLAGSYCFWAGLALAPYRAFYALGLVGITIAGIRIRDSQARGRGRRHFHRHWSKAIILSPLKSSLTGDEIMWRRSFGHFYRHFGPVLPQRRVSRGWVSANLVDIAWALPSHQSICKHQRN